MYGRRRRHATDYYAFEVISHFDYWRRWMVINSRYVDRGYQITPRIPYDNNNTDIV